MELLASVAPQLAAPIAVLVAIGVLWVGYHRFLKAIGEHLRSEMRTSYSTREDLAGVQHAMERIESKVDTLVSQVWEARGRQAERDSAPRRPLV